MGRGGGGADLCFEPLSCHRLRNGGERRACLALCGLLSSHKVRGWWGSTSSEGCPELSIRYQELLLRYEMSGRVSSKRQECRCRPQRAQLDALSLSFLLVTSTHDFVLSEWQFKGIKGRSRCLVLSCTVFRAGPRLFYILFTSLLVWIFIAASYFFPLLWAPPLPQTSTVCPFFCFCCRKSQDYFLLLVF